MVRWPFRGLLQKQPSRSTLDEKLSFLAQFGFCLETPFTVESLLSSKTWERDRLEQEGLEPVLVALGETEEQPPWRPLCSALWHFDTECIEDHGAYLAIAERMKGLARGSLPITNIRDYVDVDGGVAWLEFESGGKSIHVDFRVNDDWVDSTVFDICIDQLRSADPERVYLYYDLKGQDCLLSCAKLSDLEKLRQAGMDFEELTAQTIG